MPGADPPLYLKILLAAALLVVIAVARLPFIGNVLAGEEGDFAALVLDDVPTSVVSDTHLPRDQIGFIDGKPVLTSFHRTIMPYIILERLAVRSPFVMCWVVCRRSSLPSRLACRSLSSSCSAAPD